jgi:hypothetical protein
MVLTGGELKTQASTKKVVALTYQVNLPSTGIWYAWIKVTPHFPLTSLLTYDFDGISLPQVDRSEIIVQPYLASHWIGFTRSHGYKIQVMAKTSGSHTLRIILKEGNVTIEKVELTQSPSVFPVGSNLNYNNDAGLMHLEFPKSKIESDGFRENWQSPQIKPSGTSYYVDSNNGSDTASGLSPDRAWRGFAPVNSKKFMPGDAIFLKRGGYWEESLSPNGSGKAGSPITLGAYGRGPRPKINSINKTGVTLINQSHWTVQDLEVTNFSEMEMAGILVYATKQAPQPKDIRIYNCIAHSTGGTGIVVGSDDGPDGGEGFDGAVIENCLSYDNGKVGIKINGNEQNGCRNGVIRYCTAYGNLTDAGIWLKNGQNGLIEHCIAFNNLGQNIFAWNAINVTIRNCEAYRAVPSARGGSGISMDTCKGGIIEYCYSHNNEGPGIMLAGNAQFGDSKQEIKNRYNVVRYCIAENNYLGIEVADALHFGKVYNNFVVQSGKDRVGLMVEGSPVPPTDWEQMGSGYPFDTEFSNNILLARDGAVPAWIDDLATAQGNVFDYNLYWREDSGAPLIKWAGHKLGPKYWWGSTEGIQAPKEFGSLSKFQKSVGQEAHGISEYPMFVSSTATATYIGRLPMETRKLKTWSPAVGAGKKFILNADWLKARRADLTDTGNQAYGISLEPSPDDHDYWGSKVDRNTKVSIGAGEP